MKALIPLSLVFLALSVQAETRRTPEQSAVLSLRTGIGLYQTVHDGLIPTNWVQIGESIDIESINNRLHAHGLDVVQSLYAFVNSPVPVPEYQAGSVFLIRCKPLEDDTLGLGRYLISNDNGGFGYRWMAEEKVRAMFASANVPLPQPDEAAAKQAEQSLQESLRKEKEMLEALDQMIAQHAEQLGGGEQESPVPVIRPPKPRPSASGPEVPQSAPASAAQDTRGIAFFQWIGVSAVGVLGLALIIVLFRAARG